MKKLWIVVVIGLIVLSGCQSYERDKSKGEVRALTVENFKKKLSKKEDFVVAITQESCEYCTLFTEMFTKYSSNHRVVLNDIVIDNDPTMNRTDLVKELRKTFPDLQNTPSIYYVKDGKLDDTFNYKGVVKEDEFDDWVVENKLDAKK